MFDILVMFVKFWNSLTTTLTSWFSIPERSSMMSGSNEIILNLPGSILDDLHCFMCEGYLSCSPVRVLPNGNNICGRCVPLNTDGPINRLVSLEVFLKKMSFPCVFSKYGCSELLLFGTTAKHESKCVHKPLQCPTKNFVTCEWEGNATQLFKHFKEFHPNFVKDKTEFQLKLTEDARDFLMALQKSIPFIIKYLYKAKERNLCYDVRNCGNTDGAEVSWKTQLINATDVECSLNLKSNECLSYDETFCGVQNGKVLDLSKFLESLDHPDSMVVAVNFKIVKLNCEVAKTVDSNSVEGLKCYLCCNYITGLPFNWHNKTICGVCRNSKPSKDANLLQLVNKETHACRWRQCNFVGNSIILIKDHEMNCEFRMCLCVYSNCAVTFKRSAAANHLQTHTTNNGSTVYIPKKNQIIYKTSFAQEYKPKHILAIRNEKIVLTLHKCTMLTNNSEHLHEISLYLPKDTTNNITGTVQFEHDHCKHTENFKIHYSAHWLQVTLEQLPLCFQETDKLIVTVDVV